MTQSSPSLLRKDVEETLAALAARESSELERDSIFRELATLSGQGLTVIRKTYQEQVAKAKKAQAARGAQANPPKWLDVLITTKNGYKVCAYNTLQALEQSEYGARLKYNEFSQAVCYHDGHQWREWQDTDNIRAAAYFNQHHLYVTADHIADAIKAVAIRQSFHPVREYLEERVWDGTPRLDRWLQHYLGAEDNPLNQAIGASWMISAVARIFEPGCKADHMLVLEGPQGVRKSTALSVLGGPWFSEDLPDLKDKDSKLYLFNKWIIEIAELAAFRGSGIDRIKAFASNQTDHFRPPYERRSRAVPRQCVFAGSVNDDQYLNDPTGGRRFWPVKVAVVHGIRTDALKKDRTQLWAEATQRYLQHESWWLTNEELIRLAADAQRERTMSDPWEDVIEKFIYYQPEYRVDRFETQRLKPLSEWRRERETPLERVTSSQIFSEALGIAPDKWTLANKRRITQCFQKMGWIKKREPKADPITKKRGEYYTPSLALQAALKLEAVTDPPTDAIRQAECHAKMTS